MSDIVVTNQAQLDAALKAAKGGETIKLAAGTYTSIALNGVNYASNVTITSLDANNPAVVQKVGILNSSNITFQNLTLARNLSPTDADYTQLHSVVGSSNITFDDVTISGGSGDASKSVGWGLFLRNSSNITVENSSVDHVAMAINVINVDGLTIQNNNFHDNRRDGLNLAQVDNVLIDGNMFSDMHPVNGEHPDAIQFMTSGTTESSTNITISNNVVMQGNGDPIQGIFMNDEIGTLPYQNVNITNNLIYVNGLNNGISITDAQNVNISSNTVVSRTDDTVAAWVSLAKITNATVANNVGDKFITDSASTNIVTTNNSWLATDSVMLRKFENLNAAGAERLAGMIMNGIGFQPAPGSAAAALIATQAAQKPSVPQSMLLDLEFNASGLVENSRFNSSTTTKALNTANLSNGMYHVQTGQGFEVARGNAVQLYSLPALTLSFNLQRDSATAPAGQILGIFQSWSVSLTSAGELNFTMKNSAGTTYSVVTSGAKLIDTKSHSIALTYDSKTGSAVIYVDGVAKGSGAMTGTTQAISSWGLYVGNAYGTSFSGKIGSIEVQDQALTAAQVKSLGSAASVRSAASASIAGVLGQFVSSASNQSASVAIQAPVLASATASVASVASVASTASVSSISSVSTAATTDSLATVTSKTSGLMSLSTLSAAKLEQIALFHS